MACRLYGAMQLPEPNVGILSIELLETTLIEVYIEIQPFSFKKMHLKMSSAMWRPYCLDHNVSSPGELPTLKRIINSS